MERACVRLGDILCRSNEWIKIDPANLYKEVTVKMWGKGVVLRREVAGQELLATRRQRVHSGQFILSRIDARHGAFGLIPSSLEGAVVTSDFPVFYLDETRIVPTFLAWLSRTEAFVALCREASEGSTNRVRLVESAFLNSCIDLPPLDEQLRIVEVIENVSTRLDEAIRLRDRSLEHLAMLVQAEEMRLWPSDDLDSAPSLEEVTTFLSRGRQSQQGESNHFLIKTQHVQMGRYVPTRMTLAPDVASKVAPNALVRAGDVLIACSAAGCLGRVALFTETNKIASTDTHVAIARANESVILPAYLYAYLRGAQGQFQLRSRERGDWQREKVSFRLTELNLSDLKQVPVPVPSLKRQQEMLERLDAFRRKTEALGALQQSTALQLNALLPALLDRAFKGKLGQKISGDALLHTL